MKIPLGHRPGGFFLTIAFFSNDYFLDFPDDFAVLGEAVQRFFREHQLAVDFYFENAAARGDEFRFDLKGILDFACQTGGARFVVSDLAVFDGYLHGDPP